ISHVLAAYDEPGNVHRGIALFLGVPKLLVAMLAICDRGNRLVMFLDYPCPAGADAPQDPAIARCPVRPWRSPLIGSLGPQPGGRVVDHADDRFHVVLRSEADGEDFSHCSVDSDGSPLVRRIVSSTERAGRKMADNVLAPGR